jgi:hypothetical protein
MLATPAGTDGLGEPLNVVISGESDSVVLAHNGFLAFMQSVDMSAECLGLSEAASLSANLGDGQGTVNATTTLRYNFGDPSTGTCTETIEGGNHLRYWQQTGSAANSSAYFLAVSVEQNVTLGHDIISGGAGSNGYDLGRDWLASNATVASTSALGYTFTTTASNVTGLLAAGSSGINHDISIDGIATVLTVKATTVPANATSTTSSGTASSTSSLSSSSALAPHRPGIYLSVGSIGAYAFLNAMGSLLLMTM